MRKIEFRVWNTINKKIFEYADTGISSLGINDAINKAIKNGYIIEQFTGLKDKNGTKIFEGDILCATYNEKIFITCEWKDKGFRFTNDKRPRTMYCRIEEDFEIIGNIHEAQE